MTLIPTTPLPLPPLPLGPNGTNCHACPNGSEACFGTHARPVCRQIAAGDTAWAAKVVAISAQGDPLDFEGNPAYQLAPSTVAPPIPNPPDPAIVAAIGRCGSRGNSLPVNLQPECGCAELYWCRSNKGSPLVDRVTNAECYACQLAALTVATGSVD